MTLLCWCKYLEGGMKAEVSSSWSKRHSFRDCLGQILLAVAACLHCWDILRWQDLTSAAMLSHTLPDLLQSHVRSYISTGQMLCFWVFNALWRSLEFLLAMVISPRVAQLSCVFLQPNLPHPVSHSTQALYQLFAIFHLIDSTQFSTFLQLCILGACT